AGAPECFEAHPGRAAVAALAYWGALGRALATRLSAAAAAEVESHWLVPSAAAVVALGHRGLHRAHAHSGDVALLERLPGGAALARWLLRSGLTPVFASTDLRTRFATLVADRALQSIIFAAEVRPARSPLLDRLERAPRMRSAARGAAIALAIGRLVPIKGHDRLVRAVGGMAPALRPELVILGAGPEAERLRQQAATLGVKLTLPGEVTPEEVQAWFARATLFVHAARRLDSGRTEGAPVALQEARAVGLPIIAIATGGIAELLAGATNSEIRLLPDGDDAAVVAELRSVLAALFAATRLHAPIPVSP
ncbi:MAG TPA: glycosyltransferase, partial [Polyangia bacterium]